MVPGHQCTPSELELAMKSHGTAVYRLAYSYTHSKADAEDIYQEVFLRYYQKRPAFADGQYQKAWLLRVTVNYAKSYVRSAWFRKTVPLEEAPTLPDPESSELLAALDILPPKDRALLHLYYFEGQSTAEIAAIMKQKEGTIRVWLFRARKRLAQLMKGEPE